MKFNLLTPQIGELRNESFFINDVSFRDFMELNQFFMIEFDKLKRKYPENKDDANYQLFVSQIEWFGLQTLTDDELMKTDMSDVFYCKTIDIFKKSVLQAIKQIMMNSDHPKMKELQKRLNEKNIPFKYVRQNKIKYVNKLASGQKIAIFVTFNDKGGNNENDFTYEIYENGLFVGKFKYLVERTNAVRYNYSNEYVDVSELLTNIKPGFFALDIERPEAIADVMDYFHKTITNLNTVIQKDLI